MTIETLLICIVILQAGILILNLARLGLAILQQQRITARITIDEEEYARHRKMTIGMFKWFQRLIGRLEEVENHDKQDHATD